MLEIYYLLTIRLRSFRLKSIDSEHLKNKPVFCSDKMLLIVKTVLGHDLLKAATYIRVRIV